MLINGVKAELLSMDGNAFDEDQLAFLRDQADYCNPTLVELPNGGDGSAGRGEPGDFAQTVLRNATVVVRRLLAALRLDHAAGTETTHADPSAVVPATDRTGVSRSAASGRSRRRPPPGRAARPPPARRREFRWSSDDAFGLRFGRRAQLPKEIEGRAGEAVGHEDRDPPFWHGPGGNRLDAAAELVPGLDRAEPGGSGQNRSRARRCH